MSCSGSRLVICIRMKPSLVNLVLSVWRMGALPKIHEEIVSELQMAYEFFRFKWVLLMEVVSMF
jgi:acyl-coenzyme A synthetase/AMP-(fatty) acid ligase